MKKERRYYGLLSLALLWLMLDVYYWAMRSTAGVLRNVDKLICIATGVLCVGIIIFVIAKRVTRKNQKRQ